MPKNKPIFTPMCRPCGVLTHSTKAKLGELKRGDDTLSITMPGNPLVAAEGQIVALGFRAGVRDLWSITSARHSISGGGFTTSIKAEKPKI